MNPTEMSGVCERSMIIVSNLWCAIKLPSYSTLYTYCTHVQFACLAASFLFYHKTQNVGGKIWRVKRLCDSQHDSLTPKLSLTISKRHKFFHYRKSFITSQYQCFLWIGYDCSMSTSTVEIWMNSNRRSRISFDASECRCSGFWNISPKHWMKY